MTRVGGGGKARGTSEESSPCCARGGWDIAGSASGAEASGEGVGFAGWRGSGKGEGGGGSAGDGLGGSMGGGRGRDGEGGDGGGRTGEEGCRGGGGGASVLCMQSSAWHMAAEHGFD